MKDHDPMYIYREEILRLARWFHTILVVVWGLNVVGLAGWIFGTVESSDQPSLGLSVVGRFSGEARRSGEAKLPEPRASIT